MRVWALPLALIALAACVTYSVAQRRSAEPPEIVPMRPVSVDPVVLAKRLVSMQAGWPRSRKFDCARIKCVALTFDDGPGEHTGRLLDLLRARDVRATFFVIGQMVAADKGGLITRRIVEDGHEIGNHSWSHPPLAALSHEAVRRELKHTEDIVEQVTGVRMRVMRPPYGSTDDDVAAETRREGLAQILWNVDTFDWRDRVAAKVAKRAGEAKPGSIVLLHDIHRSTVDAVPAMLDTLTKKGYTFVTVSELYGKTPLPGRTYISR
ncbi:peptidoglycan/xylan/chitin deacetylase (PgdA/CDA1 family) [Nonomuraea polychroma]|uniref:Peptidoglycan/xylan/chitin deacetylase (PgdA/CDA1 family) n=1 Tax=Nonomuraea polychroma TaxID=46176 RepID=A0A438MEQ9_9ACTN|nr:polysaccharide deacetylase family protein [Nonomuraea polychroma]RVX44206.1 peptidoglycan/xylan/chitin deacetylase (PgdA/CDA1 family) [Nonomuraea polychroma]